MNVTDALESRRSVRAFLDKPVDPDLLRELLGLAGNAPSGGNLQPWRLYVIAGDELEQFKKTMMARVAMNPAPDQPQFPIYPSPLPEPYRSERYAAAESMFSTVNIPREDKISRLRFAAGNLGFWGAPVGLLCFIDRRLGLPQWADTGMYLQSLMLLLRERGLDSCAQAAWSNYHATVQEYLNPPEEWMLFCGLAIGYADQQAVVNSAQPPRMKLEQFAEFRGL